jgi:exonuclease SbcD
MMPGLVWWCWAAITIRLPCWENHRRCWRGWVRMWYPGWRRRIAEQVLVLSGARWATGGDCLCGVPFIRQREVIVSQAGETSQQKQLSLQQAIQQHYQALFELALQKRASSWAARCRSSQPAIWQRWMPVRSDSVRDIYIGTLDAFRPAPFPPPTISRWAIFIDRKSWAGRSAFATVAHPCRSALMSWGRASRCCWWTLLADNQPSITALPVPQFQSMQVLRGALDELQQQIGAGWRSRCCRNSECGWSWSSQARIAC